MTLKDYITRPVDPFNNHGVELSRVFTEEAYTVIIRHVQLPADLVYIFEWLTPRLGKVFWKNEAPKDELLRSYQETLTSSHSQSFMITVKTPAATVCIAQIDIERLIDNGLDHWKTDPGDYVVRFLISSTLNRFRNGFINLVRAFIEYSFQFSSVGRLVTRLDTEYRKASDLLIIAGFDRVGEIQLPDHRMNVFSCSRHSVLERGFLILERDDDAEEGS